MTDEALARALAAAYAKADVKDIDARAEFARHRHRWLLVAAMARVVIAMEKP